MADSMDFSAFFTLFSGVALLAAKPGPGVMTVATKALGEGLPSVISFMIGTNLVKILFFTLVILGYGLLPDKALILSILLKTLAALYLVWLGIQGLKKATLDMTPKDGALKKFRFSENFIAGFMLTISNPFDILFFAGILPTIMQVGSITPTDYALCVVVIVAADALVALSYAVPIALSRRFFDQKIVYKLNVVSSVGIILVGLYIGYSALPASDILSVTAP